MYYFIMTQKNKQKLSMAIDKCKKLAEELKSQKNAYMEDRMLATRYALTAASLENMQDHLTVPLDQLDYDLLLQDIESYDDRELSSLLEMFSPEKLPLERPPTPENDRLRRAILINNNNKAHPNVPLIKLQNVIEQPSSGAEAPPSPRGRRDQIFPSPFGRG